MGIGLYDWWVRHTPWYQAPWGLLPGMAGAEAPERAPMPAARPLRPVVGIMTTEGRALQCVTPRPFGYRRNQQVLVLARRRFPQGTFALVMSAEGCVGWVPAAHVAVARRGPGGDEEAASPDSFEVEEWEEE